MLYFCRYARSEILAGFVNGLFLLFIAFFILSEAVEASIVVWIFLFRCDILQRTHQFDKYIVIS